MNLAPDLKVVTISGRKASFRKKNAQMVEFVHKSHLYVELVKKTVFFPLGLYKVKLRDCDRFFFFFFLVGGGGAGKI